MVVDCSPIPTVQEPLTVNGECFEIVKEHKYLGTTIDSTLHFSTHVKFVQKKSIP